MQQHQTASLDEAGLWRAFVRNLPTHSTLLNATKKKKGLRQIFLSNLLIKPLVSSPLTQE